MQWRRLALACAIAAACVTTTVLGQSVPIRKLQQPDRSLDRGFSNIVGVRELRDGRVIIADQLEAVVAVVSADWKSVRQIGRSGRGPGEYLWPSRVVELAGDSTAIMDAANGRFLVVGPDESFAGVLDRYGRPPGSTARPGLMPPLRWTDRFQRYYAEGAPIVRSDEAGVALADSVPIERWTAASAKRDTVTFVPVRLREGSILRGGIVVSRGQPPTPFVTRPQWAVTPAGSIVILYDDPYHVEVVDSLGRRWRGAPVEYSRVRVTELHKVRWCEERERPTPRVMGRIGSSELVMISHREQCQRPSSWPEVLPPFLAGALTIAHDGRAWVERTGPADAPIIHDVFDERGQLRERVELPAGRRVIAIGALGVYTICRDESDLEFLERYSFVR